MPQVLHTENYVRVLKGTELSKSKEWKMTHPPNNTLGVYVGGGWGGHRDNL